MNKLQTIVPDILTICTYSEFAPFSYKKDGSVVGTDIELLENFAHKMGLDVNIIEKQFDGLWNMPGLGQCDISAAGMMSEGRDLDDKGIWSESYITVKRSLLIRHTDKDILKEPWNFSGKKIVVTPESAAHIDAIERYETYGAIIIPTVPSQNVIVNQLLSGEIDAFGEGDVSNGFLAERFTENDGSNPLILTDIHEMSFPEELSFAVRSSDKGLICNLNEFINEYF
tara:strand:- start:321 stop:1001 length:681 start_codon:yes stop_codon:yes gene_type:complete